MRSPNASEVFEKKLPNIRIKYSNSQRTDYSGDAWDARAMPDFVVIPKNTKEVSQVCAFAHQNDIPLTVRGAGRGYVGGCVPVKGGIALSLERLNKIKEISAKDFVAVVQPCVITGELFNQAREQGLYYPPDPASLDECSIGGNIATNAGGPRCLKYGVTRNYVLGLEVVLADGTIVRTGARTHKNKMGFNLTDLFVGSEGMLGIVTEATLRLIPYPASRGAIVGVFPEATQAAAAVEAIFHAGILPSALEVADAFTLQAARAYTSNVPEGNAFVLAEVDGQPASIRQEVKLLSDILKRTGATSIKKANGEEATAKLWDMRRAFSYGLKATGFAKLNEDVTVPRGRLLDLFAFAEKLGKKTGIQVACFGHAGDGNIHVNLMVPPGEKDSPACKKALDALFQQVIAWGGVLTGEHGIGLAKKPWWKMAVSPELDALHHRVKNALDPRGILNPGKFLD